MMDNDALDLLNHLLQYQPNLRIPAKDALNHRYFSDFGHSQVNFEHNMPSQLQ